MLRIVSGIALCVIALLSPAWSAEYPARPIRLVVAWPPGSASDLASRLIAKHAEKHFGQPIVTLNKVGGDGTLAWDETVKSDPDGYTVTVVNFDILANQAKGSSLKYDTLDYVLMFTFQPVCMYVRGTSPWKNLDDIIAAARAKPDQVTLAITGAGNFLHQAAYLVEKKYGVTFNKVPYRGTSDILNAQLSGQIDADLNLTTLTQQYIANGTLRSLLCFTKERLADYAEVPTITELGISDTDFSSWRAVATPKGLPEPVRARILDAFKRAYDSPEFQADAKRVNLDLRYMDSDSLLTLLERQYPTVRDTVKALGYARQ